MARVSLACDTCDIAALQAAIGFVEFVADPAEADVAVSIQAGQAPSAGDGLIEIIGRARFDGVNRRVRYRLPDPAASDVTARLASHLALALVEYAAATGAGPHLDVAFDRPAAAGSEPAGQDQADPWNYWVFRAGASSFVSGESSTSDAFYSFSGSANRTTDTWKVRLSASRNLSTSSFTLEDGETIESELGEWSIDALVVRSLGGHWSSALNGTVQGSTFSNSRRVVRLAPGIEFDVFPYGESSRRSLTIQYFAGGAKYLFEEETIFGRLEETLMQHGVHASLGMRQPWGQAGSSLVFTQQLQAFDRTRLTINGNANVRLIGALTLNASGSYARIRDQFTLARGDATLDEVLLRQRQLATGYRFSFSVGFGYGFGALSNTTVNPRFGG